MSAINDGRDQGWNVCAVRRDKDASKCDSRWATMCKKQWGRESTHDCALLEPLALPPDLPPPVILISVDGKVLCGCREVCNET